MPDWLGALIHNGLEAVVVLDSNLSVIYANSEALRITGYRWDQLRGVDALGLIHPDDTARAVTNIAGVDQGARPDPGLIRLLHASQRWHPVEMNPRSVSLPAPPHGPGDVLAVTLRDHQLEDTHWRFLADLAAGTDLVESLDALAHGLSSHTDGPMGIALEAHGRLITVGPLGRELTWPSNIDSVEPWAGAMATGRPGWALVEDLPDPLRSKAGDLGVGVVIVVPVDDPAADVPVLLVQCPPVAAMAEIHTTALSLRPRQAVSLALERRHSLEALRHQAHHDSLTGLANRSAFFDRLACDHDRGEDLAVCYVDLDRFKQVNDTYGHQVGDGVLIEAARLLGEATGPEDLVARLGGDEFGIVCTGRDDAGLAALAAALTAALSQGVTVEGTTHDVRASVGAARGAAAPDVVVAAADAALYRAKRDGRGTWRMASPDRHA